MPERGRARRVGRDDAAGTIDVPVPSYRMPDVVKRSAGYHAERDMDLIDLFIGSEGTLGVITTVTFRALSPAPTTAMALVPCGSEQEAIALVAELRREPASVAALRTMSGISAMTRGTTIAAACPPGKCAASEKYFESNDPIIPWAAAAVGQTEDATKKSVRRG